jgi:hypothetical protein
VAIISSVLSLDEHLSQIIHFSGTIFSKISVVIVLVLLQSFRVPHLSTLTDAGHVSYHKHFLCPQNLVTSRCIVVLFGTSLSGYGLLNVSQTAGNNLNSKKCSRVHTYSTRVHTS